MKTIQKFTVVPSLPQPIMALREIAMNLWWSWNPDAIRLFARISPDLWEETNQNPVLLLGRAKQSRLEYLAQDDTFLTHLNSVQEALHKYLSSKVTWFNTAYKNYNSTHFAYFCAEYGISESLPIYSGGLGILAGDHLKSASDLGVPLIGIGLLYSQGYFRQYLNSDGWQQERYPENDFRNMPLTLMENEDGSPITISVKCPHTVHAQIWRVNVGRVSLYLLDANISSNKTEDRAITSQLYGGDQSMRIRQEILLGIGGYRALLALGKEPAVCHVNEGHAAFLTLERARDLMSKKGLNIHEAMKAVKAGTIFTTHTPVPAGHDVFWPDLIDRYLKDYYQNDLGLDHNQFMSLGRRNPDDPNDTFNMTNLAIKLSTFRNGVSKLHGEVTREIWAPAWPNFPETEVPISAVTNGIHTRSWISFELFELFNRYLSPRWITQPGNQSAWEKINKIPNTELWRTHERRRERLVSFARRRLKQQLRARGVPRTEIKIAEDVLDPEALTICFARRFATYKRSTLLFQDLDRLDKILNNPKQPVQLIFAGKAHPADKDGKKLIRQIAHLNRSERFRRSIVFLEDYDMNVARYLLQGGDVWLNSPKYKMEASGTSGMKATANGQINMSVPDGWWAEAYDGENGWSIGKGETYKDEDLQTKVESEAIYDMLEREVVPMFYNRGRDNVPTSWIERMKHAMGTVCPYFNTNRMVQEYTDKFYIPTERRYMIFQENNCENSKNYSKWEKHLTQSWHRVHIHNVEVGNGNEFSVGENVTLKADCYLGDIQPEDIKVEIYTGIVDSKDNFTNPHNYTMAHLASLGDGNHRFQGEIPCLSTGQHGFSLRIIPHHQHLFAWQNLNLIKWH